MNFNNTVYRPLQITLLLLLGVFIGFLLAPSSLKPSFFSNSELPITEQVIALIKANYTDTISDERLTDASIEGALSILDPHSTYIPPSHTSYADEMIKGTFGGIGVQFYLVADTPMVIKVMPGSPADKAGLRRGDRIIYADDSLLASSKRTSEYVMKQMRGEEGTAIKVKIKRNGILKEITIIRGMVPSPSVPVYYMYSPTIGYLKLEHFSESTYDEFMNAMHDLKKQGMQKLILDLRNNGGGILEQATEILDEFLSEQKLLVYTQGRVYGKQEYKCRVSGIFEEGEIAVLVNENTASASEIIAGALQDYDRATIIGRRTFGKGLVQQPYKLLNGGYLRLTVAKYYTPSGRCIQKSYVGNREDYYSEIYHRDSNKDTASIDTTTYYTAKGRKVYGGGGIQPDIVLNEGNNLAKDFIGSMISTDFLNQLALIYAAKHEQEILERTKDLHSFISSYEVPRILIEEGVKASKHGDPLDKLNQYISDRIKSEMGLYLFGDEAYYRIIQKNDSYITEAIRVLD